MSKADRDRLTKLINIFLGSFSSEIKRNKAHEILEQLEIIELCIDNNDPNEVTKELPKHLDTAKQIINATPTMKCKQRDDTTEININNEALNLISKIESFTPPIKQYAQSKMIAVSWRHNESSESLVSMTTHSGDDYAYVTPVFDVYKQTSQPVFVLNEAEEACSLFSGHPSCTIS